MISARVPSNRFVAGLWFAAVAALFLLVTPAGATGQVDKVEVIADNTGSRLQVDGKDFMVIGMNWDFFPRGTNHTYSLWSQPDDVIEAALTREMSLLKGMGVNAIRQYQGVQPRWVQWIYERYGIYTVLNHALGRYGVTLNGVYIPSTDYSDPAQRKLITDEVTAMVTEFKDTPGVLMWLLGNENNYGLFWSSAETEALPAGEQRDEARASHLYSLYSDVAVAIKKIDTLRPVSMANGDLQYIDLIAKNKKGIDIFGTNVYRGISFGDLFAEVKEKLGLPVFFTEFGADAYNAKELREDQLTQAYYLIGQWKEIYEETSGKGGVGNSIGGLTFQFSDGWWKYKQDSDLDIHNTFAGWPNKAYPEDYVEGQGNMNEEWWGICAKGPTDAGGLYELYPRAAYYALQKVNTLNPYAPGVDKEAINEHFSNIQPMVSLLSARGDKAALEGAATQRLRVSGVRMEIETISTGGDRISTPEVADSDNNDSPSFQGFDHMESYYVGLEANPAGNVSAKVSFNILGNVAENAIDEIFYENRGRSRRVLTEDETVTFSGIERLKVYQAELTWEEKLFSLQGFYRTGHYHWGYEGDFFGLYPEANYGPNIDIYNGDAPLGVEITGKNMFKGLKVAFGPELWWGANPTVLVKYQRKVGPFETTAIYQEDLDAQGSTVSSFAVPLPPTRRATLHLETKRGPIGIELGGIWSGNTKIDETFQIVDEATGDVFQDQIKDSDTFGGKIKLTATRGKWSWYGQGALMGLVADGGVNPTLTYTGWRLKDSGTGNQMNVLTGISARFGSWEISPNFLWQKPIEGPIPNDVNAPGRPRNILDDPFAVRGNRETTAGELLVTYDPTPATWMYSWDSDIKEDARLAYTLGFVFRQQETTRDAAIGIFADGRNTFAFPGAPPARDLWEAYGRFISKIKPGVGIIANLFAGEGEPNGSDERLIERFGGDIRFALGSIKLQTSAKINDWGPYDYHRDFNLTYPLQLGADISNVLGKPGWFDMPQTRLGIRFNYRTLDEFSPRYCPGESVNAGGVLECDPTIASASNGNEWEIRTYLHLNLGM
ncbi:MAG: glycoside hydrolase family 2 TIM barrel-domain containing protein [Calditrichia bacterium]